MLYAQLQGYPDWAKIVEPTSSRECSGHSARESTERRLRSLTSAEVQFYSR